MTNKKRAENYRESIESLKHYLKHTSWKDDDVRREIKEEIADLNIWVDKLMRNPDSTNPNA